MIFDGIAELEITNGIYCNFTELNTISLKLQNVYRGRTLPGGVADAWYHLCITSQTFLPSFQAMQLCKKVAKSEKKKKPVNL